MTNLNAPQAPNGKPKKNLWLQAGIGAIAGFSITYFGFQFGSALGADGEPLIVIGPSEIAAIVVGAILLMCAVIVAIGTVVPAWGIKMEMFEDVEQWEDERRLMWFSVLGCLAYGMVMVILALVEPLGLSGSVPVLASIGALIVLLIYTSWRLVKHYDELWMGVNRDTCVTAMYLLLATGGTWSVLAHMDFIPALSALDWITLLGATSLIGAVWATYRRGMLKT